MASGLPGLFRDIARAPIHNLQSPLQEEGDNKSQPSKLVAGRCNILLPRNMYRPPQDNKEDGNEIRKPTISSEMCGDQEDGNEIRKTTLKGSQLATREDDSGRGTMSSEMCGDQEPNSHITLTESKTQTKDPHPQKETGARYEGYFYHPSHDLPELFRNNPHLLVSGVGPIIPQNVWYIGTTGDLDPEQATRDWEFSVLELVCGIQLLSVDLIKMLKSEISSEPVLDCEKPIPACFNSQGNVCILPPLYHRPWQRVPDDVLGRETQK